MPVSETAQLEAIAEVVELAEQVGIEVWLRGGWAMDLFLGRITRPHADVDFFVEVSGVDVLDRLLRERRYVYVTTAPRDQQRDFERDGVECSFALVRREGPRALIAGGPFAGVAWPAGMLDGPRCELSGIRCAVISVEAQIEIKEMMPVWIPHFPRRPKDRHDVALLRRALE